MTFKINALLMISSFSSLSLSLHFLLLFVYQTIFFCRIRYTESIRFLRFSSVFSLLSVSVSLIFFLVVQNQLINNGVSQSFVLSPILFLFPIIDLFSITSSTLYYSAITFTIHLTLSSLVLPIYNNYWIPEWWPLTDWSLIFLVSLIRAKKTR